DFCHRAKDAGWQVSYLPSAEVVHYHGHSSGGRRTIGKMRWEKDNLEYFLKKHWPERKLRTRLIVMMHAIKISLFEHYSK
ncbi:hypothetical protein HGA64_01750, partial [Candidatus Falkowbacteria bacterium]|nr:hypothetical protein [Candidatus Falkowbacteria bacterium]